MKVEKKYRVLSVTEDVINDNTVIKLSEPNDRYNSMYNLYDTEDEAIKAAFEFSKFMNFTIIAVYSFDNY